MWNRIPESRGQVDEKRGRKGRKARTGQQDSISPRSHMERIFKLSLHRSAFSRQFPPPRGWGLPLSGCSFLSPSRLHPCAKRVDCHNFRVLRQKSRVMPALEVGSWRCVVPSTTAVAELKKGHGKGHKTHQLHKVTQLTLNPSYLTYSPAVTVCLPRPLKSKCQFFQRHKKSIISKHRTKDQKHILGSKERTEQTQRWCKETVNWKIQVRNKLVYQIEKPGGKRDGIHSIEKEHFQNLLTW